jgi:hypothetical protein
MRVSDNLNLEFDVSIYFEKEISNELIMHLGEVVLYNIFYEASALCTSMIAQNQYGNIFHVRNLDFGMFFG